MHASPPASRAYGRSCTRRWTRTGSAIAGHGIPIRHERRHAPMRFGTFYFFQAVPWLSHDEVVHRELEQMEWTEELGFDQIWLTEHHFIDYGLAVDPGTLAAVAASRTRRGRIGLAAAILPFHHPRRASRYAAARRASRARPPAAGRCSTPSCAATPSSSSRPTARRTLRPRARPDSPRTTSPDC